MKSYNPIDVIECLLHFFPDNEFINDREKIHSAFFKLRKKYPDYLGELTFRKNMLFPRSRVLDQTLECLQPGFLSKNNPTFDTYTIKRENTNRHWEKNLKPIFSKREKNLKKMAEELRNLLK